MNLYCTDKKNLFNKYIICLFLLIPTLIIFSKFVAELIIIIINFYIILNYKKCFQNINDFKEENKENFKIFFIFFLFFLYIFLNSILNTKNIIDTFKSLFLMRFAVILLLPILIIQKINKNLILLFIVMTTLAFNVDIFYQFLNGINILGYKHNEEYSRYAGLFKNELIAGSYLFFIFFLLLLLHSISSYKKIILFIIFITYIAIYISGDRQPFLSLNLAILILTIINLKNILKYINKKKFLFLIFILILTFFISQNKINLLTKKYTNIVEYIKKTDIKDTNYYYHYSKAFLIFKSHFFFGAGYKSFRIECSNPIYDDLTKNSLDKRHFNGCTTHPHNFYFELLSELGIVGFSIFIFALFNLLKICFSNIKNNSINKYQYKILLAFLLSYFFPFKPTGSIYTNFSLIMFFFVITFFIFIKKNYLNIKNV
jgi:O-antigen ligase